MAGFRFLKKIASLGRNLCKTSRRMDDGLRDGQT